MPKYDIVTIGASAGGVEALLTIAAALPGDLPAAIFVVLHIPANGTSALPLLLSRAGNLPASHPEDGEPIRAGRIYAAPPDHHMMLLDGRIRVVRGPRENRHRPSVDPLMRSAAQYYGPRAIGVVLSGTLDDGTAGLYALKEGGGIAIVQDPADALFSGMPQSAIDHVEVDYQLPVSKIGPAIVHLVTGSAIATEATEDTPMSHPEEQLKRENRASQADQREMDADDHPGVPSPFGCPDCGGVLWEIKNSQVLRFRCRVGHAYSAESLSASQTDGLEAALWSALRALEEKASLSQRIAERAHEQSRPSVAARFNEQSQDAKEHADTIREVLLSQQMAASMTMASSTGDRKIAIGGDGAS